MSHQGNWSDPDGGEKMALCHITQKIQLALLADNLPLKQAGTQTDLLECRQMDYAETEVTTLAISRV